MSGRQFGWLASVAYLLTMVALVAGMLWARNWVEHVYSDPAAQSNWQAYRESMAQEADDAAAPVRRRVPQSAEPPALVLMRDYFGVCLAIAVVLSSALFGTLALMTAGLLVRSRGAVKDRAGEDREGESPPDSAVSARQKPRPPGHRGDG
jgi:hypothetical protein